MRGRRPTPSAVTAAIRLARRLGGRALLKRVNTGVRAVAAFTHKAQYAVEFGVDPNPDWFDHHIDQHYKWTATQNPHAWERGIYNLLAMRPRARVLELCSGDGFNAHHFYAAGADSIVGLDFDAGAVAHANRRYGSDRISFVHGDIREVMPAGPFDNIVWDAALCQFDRRELAALMLKVRSRLAAGGIFSGHVGYEIGQTQPTFHTFDSLESIADVLSGAFSNIRVFKTSYDRRLNLYFYASEGVVPFDPEWPGGFSRRELWPAQAADA